MKCPITYYGGKQRLIKNILPLIPNHTTYVEPFFGGGTVFFAKEPSKVECINDTNGELINFYKVIKHHFTELQYLIEETLYSRQSYNEAREVYRNPQGHNPIKRAWAIFVCCNQGYGAHLDKGWGFSKKTNKCSIFFKNKILSFTEIYQKRLENIQIECNDALNVIKNFDTENTFFYIDPPYMNADQGCYKGYTENDYRNLLEVLENVKGKFLLSSYQDTLLTEYTNKNNWYYKEIKKYLSMSNNNKEIKYKIEVLTANYEIKNET